MPATQPNQQLPVEVLEIEGLPTGTTEPTPYCHDCGDPGAALCEDCLERRR